MYLELDNPVLPRSGELFERVLDRRGDVEPSRCLGTFACPNAALTFAIECLAPVGTPPSLLRNSATDETCGSCEG